MKSDCDVIVGFSWQEKIAPVLARPDLLITRNVEWANLAFGFEQVERIILSHLRSARGYFALE